MRWIGNMRSCRLLKQEFHIWKPSLLVGDLIRKRCRTRLQPLLRARDSATALLKQRLSLARTLGCLLLPFKVSIDRSCEDVMLVINECCLKTFLSWIFVCV
jgi:hypothetical protein